MPDRITKEVVNQLPLRAFRGPIYVIADDHALDGALDHLAREAVWGFDTETKPSFRRGDHHLPSLLQLATAEAAFLFQLKQLTRIPELFTALGGPAHRKVGVALKDDIRKLQEIRSFQAENFYEIAKATGEAHIVNTGLRNLVAIFLGFRISKNAQVSNWARPQLSAQQISYAATDAWVSRELYLALQARSLLVEQADPLARPEKPAAEAPQKSSRRRGSRGGRGRKRRRRIADGGDDPASP